MLSSTLTLLVPSSRPGPTAMHVQSWCMASSKQADSDCASAGWSLIVQAKTISWRAPESIQVYVLLYIGVLLNICSCIPVVGLVSNDITMRLFEGWRFGEVPPNFYHSGLPETACARSIDLIFLRVLFDELEDDALQQWCPWRGMPHAFGSHYDNCRCSGWCFFFASLVMYNCKSFLSIRWMEPYTIALNF